MAAKRTSRRSAPAGQRRRKVPAPGAPRRKALRKAGAPRGTARPRARAPAGLTAPELRSWWRRHLLHLILAAFLLGAFAWLWLIPVILGGVAARELDRAFAGEVRVWALSGFLGDAPVLKGLELIVPGARRPLLRIDELTLHLREPLYRGGGLDVAAVSVLGGTVVLDLAAFADEGPEATPGDQPDAGEERPASPAAADSRLPERLCLRDARLELRFGAGFTVPITGLRATVVRRGPDRYEVEEFCGTVHGGSLEGSGDARVEERIHWHLQLRLGGVRIEDVVRGTSLAPGITRGELGAYIDLRSSAVLGGPPRGAGWISARQSHLWEVPLFSALLDALGIVADEVDALREAQARFRVDHGRFHFGELIAVGRPLSLYGNGSMRLDGSDLRADFIPRFGRGLTTSLPLLGEPSQVLLDVIKGAAVEVRLRGRLGAPEITTMPLPVITGPVQAFFDAVAGE